MLHCCRSKVKKPDFAILAINFDQEVLLGIPGYSSYSNVIMPITITCNSMWSRPRDKVSSLCTVNDTDKKT